MINMDIYKIIASNILYYINLLEKDEDKKDNEDTPIEGEDGDDDALFTYEDESEFFFRRAIELDPKMRDSYIRLAQMLVYQGKYKESLDTVLKSCALIDENIYKKMLAVYDK